MVTEIGDMPRHDASEAKGSAFHDELIQTASLGSDCNSCVADDAADGAKVNASQVQLPENIETMKEWYPVIGELFGDYRDLLNGGDPAKALEAESQFNQAVTDSDANFETTETGIKAELEAMPALPKFKQDYLSANKGLDDVWQGLPKGEQDAITAKMKAGNIPMSEAAGDNKALAEAAAQVENVFNENLVTILKLTELQSNLSLAYQQKLYARVMHGDALEHGSKAAGPDKSAAMLSQKDQIDQQVAAMYKSGYPNLFDYIK